MKPGLARAVPMGIIGLIAGLLFTLVLRGLQGVEPVWDAQIGFVVGAFTASFAFVWGMGANDKRMSAHPHEPEVDKETGLVLYEPKEEHEDEEAEISKTPPGRVLSFNIWQVTYWQILLFVGLFAFATLPTGLNLQTTSVAAGNTAAIGYFDFVIPFTDTTVTVSQLTLFAFFIFFTLASLFAVSWIIGRTMLALSKNVNEVRTAPNAVGRYSFAPEGAKTRQIPLSIQLVALVVLYGVFIVVGYNFVFGSFLSFFSDPDILRIGMTAVFVLLFGSLTYYAIFQTDLSKTLVMIGVLYSAIFLTYIISYHILVGFVLYSPDWTWMRILASLGNAFGLGFLIFYLIYPKRVNVWVGTTARNLLRMAQPEEPRAESESTAIVPQSPEGNN
ncbi:MAG: hypothetical protein SFZ02_12160 [bacterium]|nr:hypothetical protein [bacterium]